MSTLQWQFGGVQVSFEKDVPVPSYISFEKPPSVPKPLKHFVYDSDEEEYLEGGTATDLFYGGTLQGGAKRDDWENIHNRFRVVATAEVTENITVKNKSTGANVDVNFGDEPRNGEWGLANMPLPRQVILQMLEGHPAAQNVLSSEYWTETVREVSSRMRGFEAPLECTFTGPGEQKWVIKRMRDIGAMTEQQRLKLERSAGRVKTNMFWLAERQWELVRAIRNTPELEELLKPEVLQALRSDNLPVKSKEVFPRRYPMLFDRSWLKQGPSLAADEMPPNPLLSDSESNGGGNAEGPPDESSSISEIGEAADRFDTEGFGAALQGQSPGGPTGTGGLRGSMSPGGLRGQRGVSSSSLQESGFGQVAASLGAPLRRPGRRSRRIDSSSDSVRSSSVARSNDSSFYDSYSRENIPPPVVITGGDHLSSETGMYGGKQRWTGRYQEDDGFETAPGLFEVMENMFQKVVQPLESYPHFNHIVRKVTDLKNSQNYAMLYPLLYLLNKDLFIGTKEELLNERLVPLNFSESSLMNLCQQTWLQKQPDEEIKMIVHAPYYTQFSLVKNGQTLFSLRTNNKENAPGEIIKEIYLDAPYPSVEAVINYLPLLLYELCVGSSNNTIEKLRFQFPTNVPHAYLNVLKTIYGTTLQNTTKEKLRNHLLFLQDDLGFYKLNKTENEYLEKRPEKTVFIVYSTKKLREEEKPELSLEDFETWVTGYVIADTSKLFYSIEKQANDIYEYPWIYTAAEPTVFNGKTHLKMELICRRKENMDLQGIGFTLMSYFFAFFATYYPDLEMVLVDVARTHGNQGLPDPMFSQLLHERFKFQRTFPLSFSNHGLYTPEEFEYLKKVLQNMFQSDKHAPYKKVYKNGMQPAVVSQEFPSLPGDVNTAQLTSETQEVLEAHAATLTFARPVFNASNLVSIYSRFIQSNEESIKGMSRGTLQNYSL